MLGLGTLGKYSLPIGTLFVGAIGPIASYIEKREDGAEQKRDRLAQMAELKDAMAGGGRLKLQIRWLRERKLSAC